MLESQGHKCRICGVPRSDVNRDLAVDHCHETNRIRGLLCMLCNIGLGYFKDNSEVLASAIRYLDNAA